MSKGNGIQSITAHRRARDARHASYVPPRKRKKVRLAPKPKARNYPCEMCGNLSVYRKSDSICAACNGMMVYFEEVVEAYEQAKVGQRKCRQCSAPLTPTRYFNCVNCVGDHEMETDDPMNDLLPDLSGHWDGEEDVA